MDGERDARRERLGAALRDNLQRRKAQARERAGTDGGEPAGAGSRGAGCAAPRPPRDDEAR